MEGTIVQYVVQGGSVGVAVMALWILYKISGNHIAHLEKSNDRFAEAIDKLSDAITALRDKL